MTTFPGIKYSERLPSGRAGVVRAGFDPSTGAEMIGAELARFGGDIYKMGMTFQVAEDAMELSTMKREYDEKMLDAFNVYTITSDENARAAILNKAKADSQSIQSGRKKVNDAFQIHYNKTIAGWEKSFAVRDLTVRKSNVKAKADYNIQAALEKNDVLGAAKEYMLLKSFFPEMSAEIEGKLKDLPNDAKLAQARILIGTNNPKTALRELNELKDLSGEQMDYRDSLIRKAKAQAAGIYESVNQEYWQLLLAKDYETLEQRLRDPNNQLPVTGEGGKNWWTNLLEKRKVGKDVVTLSSTRIKALEIISDTKAGDLTRTQALNKYGVLSTEENINNSDDKQFIEDIFAAGEAAKSVLAKRRNDALNERKKLLRDSIENTDVFGLEEATEVLKDIANRAVIELSDRFRKGEFTKAELDEVTNNLIRKYTLSSEAISRATFERELRLAETLEQQQKSISEIIASLKREGKDAEAKALLDESVALGIFTREGDTIKKRKGKKSSLSRGFFERLKEQFK